VLHRQALGRLNKAWDGAKRLYDDSINAGAAFSPAEDLDLPLRSDISGGLDVAFEALHKHSLPTIFAPNPTTRARSYRERAKGVYSVRHLSKVGNLYQYALQPGKPPIRSAVGHLLVQTAVEDLVPDVVIISILDALNRLWLLLLSFVLVGLAPPHENADGVSKPWFTLTDAYKHYGWIYGKACGGRVKSLLDFLRREQHVRIDAISLQMGGEKLSLADALARARKDCGDLWVGLYEDPMGGGEPPHL